MSCTNIQKANLASQFSIFYMGSFSHARTTRPNELTRTPSNDPPERIYMGTSTTKTKRQGRVRKMSCTNVHKANFGSQLRIFDTGSFTQARPHSTCLNEFTRTHSPNPPE